MPIKVGITGGIGAGKSVVTNIFRVLGAPTYDSDTRAKLLMEKSTDLVQGIKKQFGDAAYQNGKLNRRYLADQVFNDESKIAILNALVHPAVAVDFTRWMKNNQQASYIIKEAALLVESGAYKSLDYLILVDAPKEIRIQRTLNRDPQRTREEIISIMKKQMTTEDIRSFVDYEICNDGEHSLIQQALILHKKFRGD